MSVELINPINPDGLYEPPVYTELLVEVEAITVLD